MTETRTGKGKVVVNRAVSLDGFIAGPGDDMDWITSVVPPETTAEVAAQTGALLIGRRTFDVGSRMEHEETGSSDYPFTGRSFLLTHRPPDPPIPGLTVLSGDIEAAVATALDAAGGKDLELLGADVAAQAFRRGLVDEVLVYVLPVVLGDGVPFSPPGAARVELEPIGTTQSGPVTMLRFRVRR